MAGITTGTGIGGSGISEIAGIGGSNMSGSPPVVGGDTYEESWMWEFATNVYVGNVIGYSQFASTAMTPTADQVYLVPVMIPTTGKSITRIGVRCSTAEAAKSALLGLYDSATNGLPGALVASGTASLATTGDKEVTVAFTPTETGLYYMAMLVDSTTAAISGHSEYPSTNGRTSGLFGASDVTSAANGFNNIIYTGHAFGSGLPSDLAGATPDSFDSANPPGVWVRSV